MIEDMKPLKVALVSAAEQAGAAAAAKTLRSGELTLTDAAGLYLIQECKLAMCWSADFHLELDEEME
jgi:hypothetical protein